jgi:hypothetical protein
VNTTALGQRFFRMLTNIIHQPHLSPTGPWAKLLGVGVGVVALSAMLACGRRLGGPQYAQVATV